MEHWLTGCFVSCYVGIGASYGTSKSGVGIAAMGVLRPDLMMKCIIPVVMAGIIAVSHVFLSRTHLTSHSPPSMPVGIQN